MVNPNTIMTERLRSIALLQHLSIMSGGQSGGDWKDDMSHFSGSIPVEMPGITADELSELDQGGSCPRATDAFLDTLLDELEDPTDELFFFIEDLARKRVKIRARESGLKALKKI